MKLRKLTILFIAIIIAAVAVGFVVAQNGWIGGSNAPSVPSDTMTRGLVGYWSFDEGGGTTAYDASDNANNGTLTNGPQWTQGKVAGGLSFDGTDDYVDVPDDDSLNITGDLSIEAWIYPIGWGGGGFGRIFVRRGDAPSGGYVFHVNDNNDSLRFFATGGDVADSDANSISLNQWQHVSVTRSGTSVSFYVNGIAVGIGTISSITSGSGVTALIGNNSGQTRTFDGLIDEMRIYNRALSAAEIRYHYNRGGPVAYWSFDEGNGTTTFDATDNNNDGTLNLGTLGNTATSAAWVSGKHGTALSFDGVDDYVEVSDSASLRPSSGVTVGVWIYPHNAMRNSWQVFLAKTGNSYFNLRLQISTGKLQTVFRTTSYQLITSESVLQDNVWQHVALTYNGSNLKLYIDGKEILDDPSISGNINWDTGPFSIGSDVTAGFTSMFDGLIDDVRIYNYARTPDEIRLDYNAGFAARFGPTSGCDTDPGSCMNLGLVGYWNFDESGGQTANDRSTYSNDGTLGSSASADAADPKWTKSGIPEQAIGGGGALEFDGVDDYVEVPASDNLKNITDAITISAWMKYPDIPTDGQKYKALEKYYDTFYFGFHSSPAVWTFRIRIDGVNTQFETTPQPVNSWYYYVLTYDGSYVQSYIDGQPSLGASRSGNIDAFYNDTYSFHIGSQGGINAFNGLIDEVRIYNRALSAEEVRYHYNRTLPSQSGPVSAWQDDSSLVGYWRFDEGSGTTINDKSGNDNTGTMGDGTCQPGSGSCPQWAPGKIGPALSFDGSDDYVDAGNDSSLNPGTAWTLEAWIYANTLSGTLMIANKGNIGTNIGGLFFFRKTSASNWDFVVNDGTNSATAQIPLADININTWYHVVAMKDGTTLRTYLNGVFKDSDSDPSLGSVTTTDNLWIGRDLRGLYSFNGIIDDVRIYNRALSASEIWQHYINSQNVAAHFGPTETGSLEACSTDPGSCMSYGLVGYWNFDESGGQTANDRSTYSNDGTLGSSVSADSADPKWTKSGIPEQAIGGGSALQFDGVDDYVQRNYSGSSGLDITEAFTLEVWLKPTAEAAAWEQLIGRGPRLPYGLRLNMDPPIERVQFGTTFFDDSKDYLESTYGIFNLDEWQHLVAIFNKATGEKKLYYNGSLDKTSTGHTKSLKLYTTAFEIGGIGITDSFNGLIDEVRIYNRALSAEEVRYHYNRGGPVGHWKMDGRGGSTVYDYSINNNDGTLYVGTLGNTATSSAWVAGKYGSALSFDGVDDYVDLGANSSLDVTSGSFTQELWAKVDSVDNSSSTALLKIQGFHTGLEIGTASLVAFRVWNTGSTSFKVDDPSTVPIGSWNHWVGIFDNTNNKLYLYKNGSLVDETDFSGTPQDLTGQTWIAYHPGLKYFNGLIDDVRIYNYARSPSQILVDYNAGLSTHFK